MTLTKAEILKQYARAHDLLEQAIGELFPIQAQEDISDLLGRAEALKSKIEEKAAVLHEFDPN